MAFEMVVVAVYGVSGNGNLLLSPRRASPSGQCTTTSFGRARKNRVGGRGRRGRAFSECFGAAGLNRSKVGLVNHHESKIFTMDNQ